ncbi:MAG TPA: hotdog domain-containing protein [Candidatus Thermoplasmatota archaeon]|nr:hotdog domain-containing protein [Candidatus Thermoplasmatota archaeon]
MGRALAVAVPAMDTPYELVTRRLCLIKDTGHSGTLWGGTMMGWVDEAGAIYAGMVTRNPTMVTKAFTEINFTSTVNPGDMVEFYGRVARWGTTSVHIELKVTARRPTSHEAWDVLTVTGTFVAIDERGRKTPILKA